MKKKNNYTKLLIINGLFLALFSIQACVGDLGERAQKNLYAFAHANKIEIPKVLPQGYEEINLEIKSPVEPGEIENQWLNVNIWAYPHNLDRSPVIIYAHGNAVNIGGLYQSGLFGKISSLGVHVVIYDYPSYGNSTGLPTERSLVASSEETIAWVKTRFPQSPIIFWGRSLGAGVAIQTVLRNQSDISYFILTSPWSQLEQLMQYHFGSIANDVPAEWRVKNIYDSVGAAQKIIIPGTIIHGTKDEVIPFKFGEELFNSFSTHKVKFVSIPDRGHNDLYGEENFWQIMQEIINNN